MAIKDTNKKEKSKKTEMQLEIVLKFMETDKEYKTSEIADILDLKGSRVRKLLAMLVEEGKIEALGGNRNRRYAKKLM